jgi:phosphate transport system permease protein
MRAWFNRYLASGDLFVWGSGAGLAISLLMVVGLLLLIMLNGLGYFWPADIVELTLSDGTHVVGQLAGRETIPPSSAADSKPRTRIRLKIGNRDLYGLDFKWVNEDAITSRSFPPEAVLLERREWGNMYGRINAVYRGDEQIAKGNESSWQALLPLINEANELRARILRIERVDIGAINTEIERMRLKMRRLELKRSPPPIPPPFHPPALRLLGSSRFSPGRAVNPRLLNGERINVARRWAP